MPYYRADENDFKLWQRQLAWVGDDKDERKYALFAFYESLTAMLKKNGYVMDHRWNSSQANPLINWIYRIAVEEEARRNHNAEVAIPEIIHRNTQEDYDYFCGMIDAELTCAFMDEWSDIEDLSPLSLVGYRIRYELQEFLYHFVDLERSKQGQLIARFWDDSDSDVDEKWSSRDVYLRDASEGFHGGRGSKV
jgi:hypothetical protein